MKKYLLLFAAMFLVACGGESIYDKKDDEDKAEQEVEKETEKPLNGTIKLDDELKFKQFDVEMRKIKLYEKKEKILVDLHFDWTNRIYEYDKTSFFIVSLLDVKQGDAELEEINDAWNVENKLQSDVFFQNAAGGKTGVKLTYELEDKETPIELIFTPTDDEENPETITIEIN